MLCMKVQYSCSSGTMEMKQTSKKETHLFTDLLFHVSGTEVVETLFGSEADDFWVNIGVPLQNVVLDTLYQNAPCSVNIQHTIAH